MDSKAQHRQPPRTVVRVQELLDRGKRLTIIGALLMWVVSPVLIGGLITVGLRTANASGGHVSPLILGGFIVWAVVCLVVLVAAFGFIMGGIFLWWRSSHPEPMVSKRRSAARRGQERVLRDLQADIARAKAAERKDAES